MKLHTWVNFISKVYHKQERKLLLHRSVCHQLAKIGHNSWIWNAVSVWYGPNVVYSKHTVVSLCQFIITLYGLVISLCGFIIMLCRFFISLCEFVIMLCQLVISLCGFTFLLCQFFISFNVGLSLCYVDFSFRYVSFTLSLFYVSASLRSVIVSLHCDNLTLLYISSWFRYVGL